MSHYADGGLQENSIGEYYPGGTYVKASKQPGGTIVAWNLVTGEEYGQVRFKDWGEDFRIAHAIADALIPADVPYRKRKQHVADAAPNTEVASTRRDTATVQTARRSRSLRATPSETLNVILSAISSQNLVDANGRLIVIPPEIIDLYGSPHGLIRAVSNTMRLLIDATNPSDGRSAAQHNMFKFIADGCDALVNRIDAKAKAFDELYGDLESEDR